MQISKAGAIELANYEAMSHTKYIDSGGVHTIGIGMTSSDIPDLNQWSWTRSLTTEECVQLYLKHLRKYENAVIDALEVEVSQHEYDALVSICYNIGTGGFRKSTFLRRLNNGRPKREVAAAFLMWNRDNGRTVKGLTNRRNAESKIFLTGEYTNDGTVTLIQVNPNTHKPVYKGREDISNYF